MVDIYGDVVFQLVFDQFWYQYLVVFDLGMVIEYLYFVVVFVYFQFDQGCYWVVVGDYCVVQLGCWISWILLVEQVEVGVVYYCFFYFWCVVVVFYCYGVEWQVFVYVIDDEVCFGLVLVVEVVDVDVGDQVYFVGFFCQFGEGNWCQVVVG